LFVCFLHNKKLLNKKIWETVKKSCHVPFLPFSFI